METMLTGAAYLVGLLYGCELLRGTLDITWIFVRVMNESEFTKRPLKMCKWGR